MFTLGLDGLDSVQYLPSSNGTSTHVRRYTTSQCLGDPILGQFPVAMTTAVRRKRSDQWRLEMRLGSGTVVH